MGVLHPNSQSKTILIKLFGIIEKLTAVSRGATYGASDFELVEQIEGAQRKLQELRDTLPKDPKRPAWR